MNPPTDDLNRIASDEIPWLSYPPIPNSMFKILKVDEATNTVILRYRMGPHVTTKKHGHHCVATAYTLDGAWYYDDLKFTKGDIAYESSAQPHQPLTRDEPAELLTTLIGGVGNDALIEEYGEDGKPYLLRTRFFKALQGITPEQLQTIDFNALLT